MNTKGKRVDGVEFLVNKNREQNKTRQRARQSWLDLGRQNKGIPENQGEPC